MRQKITAGRLWGLISPMISYMVVQVVVSGIVTFGIIFAANFVLHDYATFSASKIGMKIAEALCAASWLTLSHSSSRKPARYFGW